ncbi:MAG: FAD-binding oxidoreductase [Candidatus Binatia bacterium]
MSQYGGVAARFRDLIGAGAVATGEAVHPYAVNGLVPGCVLFPATVDDLSRCAAVASQAGLAMIPAGNGTQLSTGRQPRTYDVAVSTRRLRGILAHEAADMTVTVEAGLTLAELNTVLASSSQRLPLDPPHPERTTIGALIATDTSGPLRLSQGKVRDLLIGITVVLADGTVIKGGGRVVKNVAGYDLMKLFTGSFGTLGIIARASFKVRPLPAGEMVCVVPAANIDEAVTCALDILAAPLAPLYVEALNHGAVRSVGMRSDAAAVVVNCGGGHEEIEAQQHRLQERVGDQPVRRLPEAEGAQLSAALRDFPADGLMAAASVPVFEAGGRGEIDAATERTCGCKVSLLPSQSATVLRQIDAEAARRGLDAAVLAHAGSGVASIRIGGSSATAGALGPFAEWLRTAVRAAGGWVVFGVLPVSLKDRVDPWGSDIPALALMRGIKDALDPQCRLSPGRFVGGI